MPYITKESRYYLDHHLCYPNTTGELNYQFSMLAREYMARNRKTYKAMNDVIGAMEAAKLEFYRRIVVPYEEEKMAENGDLE